VKTAVIAALVLVSMGGCVVDVGVLGSPDPDDGDAPGGDHGGGGGGGGGGTVGGDTEALGKLSNNGLFLDHFALAEEGPGPLGSWIEPTTARARDDLLADLPEEEDRLEHIEYMAMCALDAGTELVVADGGGERRFAGLYGLAPGWVDGACDESCQRWVSACLLAHTNMLDLSVPLSLRGAHPGLVWDADIEEEYATQEGAFYGNLFLLPEPFTPPVLYSCFGRGLDPSADYMFERICSAGAICGLVSMGPCPEACQDDAGSDSYFGDCNDPDAGIYREVITTYLETSGGGGGSR